MTSPALFWMLLALLVLALTGLGMLLQLKRHAALQTQQISQVLQERLATTHLALLNDLGAGLDRLGDRMLAAQADSGERLRALLASQTQRFDALAAALIQRQDLLKAEMLGQTLEKLAEAARADREMLQDGLRAASLQQAATTEALSRIVNERLDAITGVVNQRLDEGFKKTNETFANVMARLAAIDEAQKKIGELTTNVVSLQELLGDKKARGAFGEVQLEALVQNALPPDAYTFQHTLASGARADCVLKLPEPTGLVAVDAKFPLENYHRMFAPDAGDTDRKLAQTAFRADIRRHVDAIASKYIVAGETSDGAMMFVPAEAVFAEIHAYHPEVVAYAQTRRVWIVSPTTLMAVLNTARAVLKDVETRKQIHLIKDALGKLAKDFSRFDERMQKLATHIRQASEDAQEVHVSSKKISSHFTRIESVQLENLPRVLAEPDNE
jgi:DNA recombination protein RmuC